MKRNETLGREVSYVTGTAGRQLGRVGDITAGLEVNGKCPYVSCPYIEWYSEANGRVALELFSGQMEILWRSA